LKLNDAGIGDIAMSALAHGISKHPDLEHLDLKGNLFEEDGLEALLVALFETMSCKSLYLSGFKVAHKNAECLAELISHEKCKIKDLELNETEISDHSLKLIMEATQVHKKLSRISFSRTVVTLELCKVMEK
jgi:Ran GTPase-activating protein (RanGAP) involved in mRNA processing and transport